ncbi:DDE-type integrase/transposase/recombinase [Mesorhizobium australicum]|uniref:Mu transposase, C-terminal n=1 Tax=Mesorhizobium australicum TaxID=536018 RepID=A0A1X7NVF5_9HYPH|nr:DDE-type integrase/transposase/recombinase [Mesorhizobium australicum]SMH42204.1 Mu transposase, C-terminal [Mesorhizobium australicum]
MKEWLTAREIAAEALPDLPATESAMLRLISRECWSENPAFARSRAGRGGGMEYNVALLPTLAQVAYRQKHIQFEPQPAAPAEAATDDGLTDRAKLERDARLAIVAAYQRFTKTLRLGHATHLQVFTDKYNQGSIEVPEWVRTSVPALSKRSLVRWIAAKRDGRSAKLGVDRSLARKGTGVLDRANDGKVRAFMLALIAHQPHLSGEAVRTQCRAEFGDTIKVISKGVETVVAMPPVRTFQHALKALKADNKVVLTKLTNPDLYRSTMAPSGIGMLRHITEPNQLWQIDASPVDALCTDGRHSIYACIDIATRRTILSMSKTPRASAVALLIRKAILAWGAPEVIQTDNGSDFVAKDTQRLFASLGIDPDVCDAYTPEQKGHVERVIKTFQHMVGPLLPGYVGHSVADRKVIEGRKSFAKRLGETENETFSVGLNGVELQGKVDEWIDLVYQHRPHAGLKERTPFNVALESTRPLRTVDVRALDLLLMPVAGGGGERIVTKFGIRIDGYHYMTPTILPGTPVLVRQDPLDLGRALAFAQDGGAFLGEAICPELRGIHPETYVRAAKEIHRELVDDATRQVKADMKRIAKGPALIDRALDVARRDAPNVIPLPKREEAHTTPQISAAIAAMGEAARPTREPTPAEAAAQRRLIAEMEAEDERRVSESFAAKYEGRMAEIEAARTAHLPRDEKVVALPETPKERYRRYVEIRRAVDAGLPVVGAGAFDAVWAGRYEASTEFRVQSAIHAEYGEAYLS